MIQAQSQSITFKRDLKGILLQEWQDLLFLIQNQHLIETSDHLSWKWEPTGIFSTQSTCKFLNFGGVEVLKAPLLQELPIPYKIRVFMWLLAKNKILIKQVLQGKGWQGPTQCVLCPSQT